MRRLAERTQDTVFLSARDRDEAVCLERVIGDYPIKTLTLSIGDRRPLGVGAGSLALLSALSDRAAEGNVVVTSGKPSSRSNRSWSPKTLRVPVPVRSSLRTPSSRTRRIAAFIT